ncbi:hypothetical protein TanjilG_18341 [Lupinus angustifolius]|uniref:Elongator complex protein 2 n=1 Tax=Lupinus angustifolius TaxID=3871 RepID=A0A1J7HWZ5_LUPAN|nr:hypothetical protein TanjilG_18341 [Lupinus angustifolius]
MNVVNVGELSHCALGFYGGHWSPNGDSILAHRYGGSFHLWKNVGNDNWLLQKVPSGHFSVVTDIAWARSGDCMTRQLEFLLHGKLRLLSVFWHEIARPQIHGHDINCMTVVPGKGNHRFVSGADEKVARIFEAPLSFLRTLDNATLQMSYSGDDVLTDVQILGANMSALGRSQKPIYVQAIREAPERNGIDGLDTLETIPDAGELVASSCKVWLWEVGSWKSVGRLQSHSLTVTQMEFSHDDNFLLAVSRDRQFSIFTITRTDTGGISYSLLAKQEGHKRIILSCSWNPHGHEFATGSRDMSVKIWAVEKGSSVRQLMTLPQLASSVTALSWAGLRDRRNDGLLAIGMENGQIELWRLSYNRADDGSIAAPSVAAALVVRIDPFICHASTVNRLAWRNNEEDHTSMQLASCGADNCVRVFDVIVE